MEKHSLQISRAQQISHAEQREQNLERLRQDRLQRMAYDLTKERTALETDQLWYDKIKWPVCQNLIFKRRQIGCLPQYPKHVSRLIGMKWQAPSITALANSRENSKTRSSSQNIDMKELDRLAIEMTEKLSQPQVTFDASFECANLDQVRQREPKVFDVWMRNDTNGHGELQWFMFRM